MKEQLIKRIIYAYEQGLEELKYEDVDDMPIDSNYINPTTTEEQYAEEFGYMNAREGFELQESMYDEYLEQILEDSDSNLTLNDL